VRNVDFSKKGAVLKKCVEKIGIIHSFGYVHCDIKLENIFMDGDEPIIGDFQGYKVGEMCCPTYTSKRCDPSLYGHNEIKIGYHLDIISIGIMYAKTF
jgi:serine/threonine protein kinase